METMKAVRIHAYGGPEVLSYEDAPLPALKDEDVLIRVCAAAVNPVDWKIREGYLEEFLHHKLPLILGWDVSGVVADVGSKVTQFKPGDEVYSRPNIQRDGAYAEYIVVNAVFDTIGGDIQKRSWQVLKPGGILVSVVSPPDVTKAIAHQCRSAYIFIQPRADWLSEMAQLIDAGHLKSIVETVLPLSQAADAQQLSQSGHTRGKIVLQVVA